MTVNKIFDETVNSGEIALLTLGSRYNIPAWTLLQYCIDTVNSALKLTTILKMCEFIINGKHEYDFAIQKHSKDLYPKIDDIITYYEKKYYNDILVLNEVVNTDSFWRLFNKQKRPNILVRETNGWFPIYDTNYMTAIQICKITVESPAEIIIQVLKTIPEIWLGLQQQKEKNLKTAYDINLLSMKNLEQIVKIAKVLDSPELPPGIKPYLQNNFLANCERWLELNEQAGIVFKNVDIKV